MTYVMRSMSHLPTEPLQIVEPRPTRGRNDLRRNLVGLSREDLKTTLVAQLARVTPDEARARLSRAG